MYEFYKKYREEQKGKDVLPLEEFVDVTVNSKLRIENSMKSMIKNT